VACRSLPVHVEQQDLLQNRLVTLTNSTPSISSNLFFKRSLLSIILLLIPLYVCSGFVDHSCLAVILGKSVVH
jgi:hypothetical protein